MNKPLVSIIIPVYNGSNYLRESIESALSQTYSPIEVLVINDGSTDCGATAEIAKSYGDCIRYFEKENGGVATALNFGIEHMRGEYFSWLSHDDLYTPHKVKRQMDALEQCGDSARIALGGYVNFTDRDGDVEPMDFLRRFTKEQMETPLFAVFHRAVHGCALLIHKSHFERAGVFKPELRTTQDYELWFRLMRGQKILYSGGMDVRSRMHEMQDSRHLGWEHVLACNELWESLFESMTRQERLLLADSDYDFYSQLYDEMLNETNYDGVVRYLHRKRIEAACEEIESGGSCAEELIKKHFPWEGRDEFQGQEKNQPAIIYGKIKYIGQIEVQTDTERKNQLYCLDGNEQNAGMYNWSGSSQDLADWLFYQKAHPVIIVYCEQTAELAKCCADYGLLVFAVCNQSLHAQLNTVKKIGRWFDGLRRCFCVIWQDQESACMYQSAAGNGIFLSGNKICIDEIMECKQLSDTPHITNQGQRLIDGVIENVLRAEQSAENEWFVKYTRLTEEPAIWVVYVSLLIKKVIKTLKRAGISGLISKIVKSDRKTK